MNIKNVKIKIKFNLKRLIAHTVCGLFCVCFFVPTTLLAQTVPLSLQFEKLSQISEFVYWTDVAQINDTLSPFIITIIGESAFADSLTLMYSTHKIKSKPLKIVKNNTLDNATYSHIIYLTPKIENIDSLLSQIRTIPSLTVCDTEAYIDKDIMIHFYETHSKTPFKINETALRISGLHISHLLLKRVEIIQPYKQ